MPYNNFAASIIKECLFLSSYNQGVECPSLSKFGTLRLHKETALNFHKGSGGDTAKTHIH